MEFSVWPSPSRSTEEIFAVAALAEELDYSGFWFADHYMPNTGSEEIEPGDVHEVWSILPAVAALTESVRLGPLVSPTSVHHPAILANRAATLDHVSGGRMVLGLGAGWQINEHKAYGIELEEPKTRVDRFEEAIQVVRSLLDEDRTTFEGSFYTLTDAPSDPSPIQAQLPILVGTSGPRMCRITAAHAQEWNAWGAPELAGSSAKVFEAGCAKVGVDPASKRRSVQALFTFTDDQQRIDKANNGPMASRSIVGSDEFVIDNIGQYAALGFDEVIVPDFALGATPEQRADGFRHFMANVAPHC